MRDPVPADYGMTEDEYAIVTALALFGDQKGGEIVTMARYFASTTGESLAFCIDCLCGVLT